MFVLVYHFFRDLRRILRNVEAGEKLQDRSICPALLKIVTEWSADYYYAICKGYVPLCTALLPFFSSQMLDVESGRTNDRPAKSSPPCQINHACTAIP